MTLHFAKAAELLIPSLFHGFGVVIQATVLGFLLATVLGMIIAIGRLSTIKIVKGILYLYLELIRGTPLLVQLVYIYYVVPLLLNLIASMFGFKTNIQIASVTAGILGLGINYGCYMSEVVRAAILSIDKGQTEAALVLGFGKYEALFRIVMPQALRSIIPSLGNYLVMMVKDTSLLAYVAVNELLLRTQNFASQTFLTIESYTFLAIAYLIISIPLSYFVKFIEYRLKDK
ncbi:MULTISPECIES: amino acid ABC transporter permease [Pelosinus]|uniref:Polar amino acid ABC transporter, inner membrane subunit n=1 Tax=Pelosinus fermentans B4 TaxID=1149862 RepID=I9LGS2_9FIRM|nr:MULTISPECIES: amino acid ABC transporter permease [Pelosinus]EIW19571.1 polar amino acid ABC transporter, inner membrane subunit [Pelosinus fermentans B4]EIW24696.1 polar amino acid ABC transporter, inner membrane subunit [Pelosinus fermentans A11]OAM96024.1 polar amino acid ABC transporter, inner membrane subunit [Pelosinus fermentans DSM 17108]SDR35487.1 polar amino acid transport system permease protein [Pelosinus fermentans]